jgi:Ni,Fe-hydrogenase III small subunit
MITPMYRIKLTGPLSRADEAINSLMSAGYDCTSHPKCIVAYGKCPLSAGRVVAHLGWKQHAAKPCTLLTVAA